MVAKGEALHESGREGVRKVRRWLNSTLMAEVLWIAGTAGDNHLHSGGSLLLLFQLLPYPGLGESVANFESAHS